MAEGLAEDPGPGAREPERPAAEAQPLGAEPEAGFSLQEAGGGQQREHLGGEHLRGPGVAGRAGRGGGGDPPGDRQGAGGEQPPEAPDQLQAVGERGRVVQTVRNVRSRERAWHASASLREHPAALPA